MLQPMMLEEKKPDIRKRARRDSLKFARYLFWVSWIWVLLFALGELLEAVRGGYYGSEAEIVQEAEILADNAEVKPDEPPKRRRSKATL